MSSKAFLKIMKDRQKAQDKQSEQQAAAEESAKPVVSIPVAAPKPKFGGNPFAVFQQQDSEEEEEEKPTKTTNGETKPSEHADDDESDAEDAENADAAGAGAAKKKKRKRKNKKKKRDLHEVLAEQEEQEAAPVPADEVQDKQEVLEASTGMSKRDKGYAKLMQTKYKKHKQYILCQSQDIVGNLPDRLNCDFIRVNDFGQKVFVFKPTPRFETIAEMYEHIRDSNDPNEMVDFVQQNPFYPEAVYDLGEYFRLKSNFKEANKLLERVMYLYEDSFSFDFQVFDNDLENVCCLDYEYNSFTGLFFKAVFKFIAILTKKGCYQSALEFNKLLLKMSPGKDPLGALFYIDHTALSAKKFDFFENFAFHFADQYLTVGKHSAKSSILLYPNVIYSLALCKFYRVLDECHKCEANPNDRLTKIEGSLAKDLENFSLQMDMSHNYWLALAFLMYPSLLKKILEETELNKQSAGHSSHKDWQKKSWAEIFNHQTTLRTEKDYVYSVLNVGNEQDTEGIEKVTAIYPTRNKILWRNKFVNIWTKTVVGHVLNLMDSKQFNVDAFMEALIMPLDDKSKDTPSGRLAKHILPFEPRIHRKLVVKDFSDAEDNLDLNNIPDNDPLAQHQGNPIQEANPLDVNQNWLQLLVNTLMPWNDLPPQQRGPNPNNQPDDNEDIRED